MAWEGWHVLKQPYEINRRPFSPVAIGLPLHARGPLNLHSNGMHATPDILYAIDHTTGIYYCRVQLLGPRLDESYPQYDAYQSCARTRTVLWMVDVSLPDTFLSYFGISS